MSDVNPPLDKLLLDVHECSSRYSIAVLAFILVCWRTRVCVDLCDSVTGSPSSLDCAGRMANSKLTELDCFHHSENSRLHLPNM